MKKQKCSGEKKSVTLRDCGEWVSGGTPNKSESSFWCGTIPWYSAKSLKAFKLETTEDRITDVCVRNGTRLVPAGTVLFVVRGMSLANEIRVGVTTQESAFNQDLKGIIPCPEIDPVYLAHFLRQSCEVKSLIDNSSHGTKRIDINRILKCHIPLPTLGDQKRIADILDKADAIRRKRREAITMIHDLRRSIYLHLFGDPATNSMNWPIMNMSEIVNDTQYGTPEKSSTEQTGLPVLRMNNITSDGDIDLTDIKWCNLEERERSKFTIKKGDLLFNRTNSPELVGKTAVWDVDEEYAYAGYLVRVRFDSEKATPEYVSGFLNSPFGKRMIFSKAKPSNNMSNFSASEFCRIEIPVPGIYLQRQFSKYVSRLREVRRRFDSAQQQTSDLFSALVQQSFMKEE